MMNLDSKNSSIKIDRWKHSFKTKPDRIRKESSSGFYSRTVMS